jgi:uncharacterized protein involved in exopolysaccharide biosynthesis
MNKRFLRLVGGGLIVVGLLLLSRGVEILLSPNSFHAIVRLNVEKDPSEFSIRQDSNFLDPFWTQEEFETLLSKAILYRVITNLNLTRRWAEKFEKPELLRIDVAYSRLKERLDVRQARGTSLIEMNVESDDPIEAAAIANEIADVYLSFRAQQRLGIRQRGISILKAEVEKLDLEITNKQSEAPVLNAASGTNGSEIRLLEDLKWRRQKISERIIQDNEELANPGTSLVRILDRAQPHLRRRGPKKGGAFASVLGGFGAIALGIVMWRKGQAASEDSNVNYARLRPGSRLRCRCATFWQS